METTIKKIIEKEVRSHEAGLDSHHITTITNGIYKQLSEFMTVEHMSQIVELMKGEFLDLVDTLIPIVEEYEKKIDLVLNEKLGPVIDTVTS
ncbi:hypothetical protein KC717_01490 [Candidatus Dojkabacteria bacterium]|uniref:Uncharacterized protein n=1 Tax=Candidatus Dojkabacteria bacterium TaxID=2099670 RepID=A0A955RK15_9BACT|nr:hypothetical protein [Candidatus Dojkabacteria bacterium]